MSVHFLPASDPGGPVLTFSLKQTYPIQNGELGPTAGSGTNALAGFYFIRRPGGQPLLTEDFTIQLPPWADADADGINDFYEASQPLTDITSGGSFEDALGRGGGGLGATWTRDAGSRSGICEMQFNSASIFGLWDVPFELLQYDGYLDYEVKGNKVTGQLKLNSADASISGQVGIRQVGPDQIQLLDGSWRLADRSITVSASVPLQRQGRRYLGTIQLSEGYYQTGFADFLNWYISISDSNDADQNGVPDLSDLAPVSAPTLTASRDGQQLLLGITGAVGRSYQLEFTPSLKPTNWASLQSVVVTNSPQTLLLPLESRANGFLRLRIP